MKEYNNYKKIEKVLDGVTIDQYKKTLDCFEDELSKKLYYYEVMMDNNKDNDPYYGLMLCKTAFENNNFKNYEERITYRLICFLLKDDNYKKKIYVIGSSTWGNSLFTIMGQTRKGFEIEEFFDDDYNSYNVNKRSPISELKNRTFDDNCCFIVGNPKYEYLLNDLPDNKFFIDYESTSYDIGTQYFEEAICPFNDHEVFVDGGAYYLENTDQFIKNTNNKFKHVYAFEPNRELYEHDLETIKNNNWDRVTLYNYALFDKEGKISFSNQNLGASRVDENGATECECNSIDNLLLDKDVSVIKMDIEGAERKALVGAEKTIKKNRPKLIICVYHEPNDVINIINLVMGMRNDYKVYLRHYSTCIYETVAYFV
jgi:FkbM family methyltransferase